MGERLTWDQQRRAMEQRLRDLQATIGADAALAAERQEGRRGEVLDVGERSDDDESSFNRDALRARRTEEILALQAALHRIDQGNYGRCIECEEQIESARLQARPESPRCLACEDRQEARARAAPFRAR